MCPNSPQLKHLTAPLVAILDAVPVSFVEALFDLSSVWPSNFIRGLFSLNAEMTSRLYPART